jgi:hypothetical protein
MLDKRLMYEMCITVLSTYKINNFCQRFSLAQSKLVTTKVRELKRECSSINLLQSTIQNYGANRKSFN